LKDVMVQLLVVIVLNSKRMIYFKEVTASILLEELVENFKKLKDLLKKNRQSIKKYIVLIKKLDVVLQWFGLNSLESVIKTFKS